MKTIHKFRVPERPNVGPFTRESFILDVDKNDEFLDFQEQGSSLVLWFRVDTRRKRLSQREFVAFFTGQPMMPYENAEYRATTQSEEYVYHLFEIIDP
ncbi:MAG: hypothetical protein AAF085_13830 [Planctomycetota bacterium]